jgi:hypothetical protein
VIDAFAGCEVIDVFARPPFAGRPVLPGRLAWRFRASGSEPPASAAPARVVVVSDAEPPPALGLAPLAPGPDSAAELHLRGAAATPRRVIAELETATVIELHAHGVVGAEGHGNASLVLSPDDRGDFALTAAAIAAAPMRGRPLVLLSACRGAVTPSHPRRGRSLAAAFLSGGAGSVVASPDPISDREAYEFFAAVRRRMVAGAAAAAAVRDERVARGSNEWTQNVVVFE